MQQLLLLLHATIWVQSIYTTFFFCRPCKCRHAIKVCVNFMTTNTCILCNNNNNININSTYCNNLENKLEDIAVQYLRFSLPLSLSLSLSVCLFVCLFICLSSRSNWWNWWWGGFCMFFFVFFSLFSFRCLYCC